MGKLKVAPYTHHEHHCDDRIFSTMKTCDIFLFSFFGGRRLKYKVGTFAESALFQVPKHGILSVQIK